MTRERLFRSPNGQRCLAGLIVLALLLSAGTPGFLQGDAGAPAAQAAPPAQDQAICKLLSSEMTDKRYSTNPGICPGAQEMCFGTFCPRAAGGGFTCEAYICRFQSAAEARQSIDLAISLGAAPIAIGDVGYETIVAGTVRSVVFARDRYAFSATVFDDRITSPFSQDQLRDLARKVDANIRGGAAPAQPPAGSLNVGIGGNYDEDQDQDQVSVTAGVENRPGVGIGDDYYEWSLDGASIHEGKEQKSLQYNTASLAAGEHVIVVKVTEKVNNVSGASGTATFKFTKKKAPTTAPPPVQPPAQPPAASAGAGTVEVTTPAGTTTVQPGGQASVQVPPGGQATVKLSCEELKQTYELLRLVWLDDEDMGLRAGHWQVLSLIAHLYEVRCGKVLGSSSNPRAVALAGNLAALRLAAEEWPVHLGVSVQEGPARFEVVHAAVALDVETATALVTSRGQNTFGVAHDPQTNVTYVAAYAGTVTVQPQNRALAPVTLQPGQRVLVTEEGVGTLPPVAAGSASAVPADMLLPLAVCGGVGLLAVLALVGILAVVVWARRRPAAPAPVPYPGPSPTQPYLGPAPMPSYPGPMPTPGAPLTGSTQAYYTPAAGVPIAPVARLVVAQGRANYPYLDVSVGGVIIGRDTSCGLVVYDPQASGQHARLDWAGHAWVIRDLNSRNGTYVNGARVTSQPVRPGDQIVVGQTVLVFQAGTAPR